MRASWTKTLLLAFMAVSVVACDSGTADEAAPAETGDFPTRGPGIGGGPPTGEPTDLPPSSNPNPGCNATCTGKICGDDGCGGSCGSCAVGLTCVASTGQCCQASCTTAAGQPKTCGSDGCGGICGQCNVGFLCDEELGGCVTDSSGCSCAGKVCGDDGCGNSCGTCPASQSCTEGQCVAAGGVGEASCESILVCSWGCAANLPECVQGCVATGTLGDQLKFDSVQACFDQYSCEHMECMGVNCSNPLATCLYSISGSQGCGDILFCQQSCPDEACMQNCILQGHLPAQAAYTTLNFCVRHYCPTLEPSCIDNGQQGGAVWDYTQCAHWYDKCAGI